MGEQTDRRSFLGVGAALAGGGLMFGDWAPAQAADIPKRTLGRTGLKVTTLSFGAIQLNDPSHQRVLDKAIDDGINLVHVCSGYQGGRAIRVVGEVMKRKRDKVFLALKEPPTNIDQHLRTLNTDYVDILIPDTDGMNDNNLRAQFEKLKKEGKIRYIGFACHNGMADRLTRAYKAGWWDCMLVAYFAANKAELDPVINAAVQAQKMGFMCMKGARGLNDNNFSSGLRALLSNPNMHTICLGQNSIQQVDANIKSVMQRATPWDEAKIRPLATCPGLCAACGQCDRACPRGVAIGEYLRAWEYRARGDLRLARELVNAIPANRSMAVCNSCGKCNGACQRGVDTLSRLRSIEHI